MPKKDIMKSLLGTQEHIPGRPDLVYADDGWISWHDWMLDHGIDFTNSY